MPLRIRIRFHRLVRAHRFAVASVLATAACGRDVPPSDGGVGSGPGGGYVSLLSYEGMQLPGTPTRGGAARAAFFSSAASDGYYINGYWCVTRQRIGPCDDARCRTASANGGSAGTIEIDGGTTSISLATGGEPYPELMFEEPLFNGGETVTFAAPGAEVPAFRASLTMPSRATITRPAKPPTTMPMTLDRARDLRVAWMGGGDARIQIMLISEHFDQWLVCRFAATDGSGIVPAEALATLTTPAGYVTASSVAATKQDAGNWLVDVSAHFYAVWQDGSWVSAPFSFQ